MVLALGIEPGPTDYKSVALPTELRQLKRFLFSPRGNNKGNKKAARAAF